VNRCAILLLLLPLAGCADLASVRRSPPLPAPAPPDLAAYRIGCPDVLEVGFAERPEWDCLVAVDVDGSIPLGEAGRVPVQGLTTTEARTAIAESTGLGEAGILVVVAVPRAGKVFITGPDNKRIRAVAYPGPTPVLDFLQLAGAIQPKESKLNDVYVVRPNVAANSAPKVYHVDVEAVLLDGDPATNVLVESSDHVYVGETRRASFARLLPDWARPAYRRIVGLLPQWD
jgi:polysaccharide biosynthesis/export protein